MPQIPVMCMIDGLSFPNDTAYLQHMQTVHGTDHPDSAMRQQKMVQANIPKNLPPGIRPEDLPSPEFMEVAQAIDSAPPIDPLPKLDLSKSPIPQTPKEPEKRAEPKPLELKYTYDGTHSCGNTVKTIMLEAKNELFAVAFCLQCNESVKRIKVHPIGEKKEEKKNGK